MVVSWLFLVGVFVAHEHRRLEAVRVGRGCVVVVSWLYLAGVLVVDERCFEAIRAVRGCFVVVSWWFMVGVFVAHERRDVKLCRCREHKVM